jgi:hypothetical protein
MTLLKAFSQTMNPTANPAHAVDGGMTIQHCGSDPFVMDGSRKGMEIRRAS